MIYSNAVQMYLKIFGYLNPPHEIFMLKIYMYHFTSHLYGYRTGKRQDQLYIMKFYTLNVIFIQKLSIYHRYEPVDNAIKFMCLNLIYMLFSYSSLQNYTFLVYTLRFSRIFRRYISSALGYENQIPLKNMQNTYL